PPTPGTRRSSRTARARPKTRRSPISRSAPPPARSRRDRPAGPIASASTTSCCGSKSSSVPRQRTPAGEPYERRVRHQADCDLSMPTLVLLRHGESTWNKENRFTGWTDVDLSDKGREEAAEAGRLLLEGGYTFDLAYTSVLKRAIRTLGIALDRL